MKKGSIGLIFILIVALLIMVSCDEKSKVLFVNEEGYDDTWKSEELANLTYKVKKEETMHLEGDTYKQHRYKADGSDYVLGVEIKPLALDQPEKQMQEQYDDITKDAKEEKSIDLDGGRSTSKILKEENIIFAGKEAQCIYIETNAEVFQQKEKVTITMSSISVLLHDDEFVYTVVAMKMQADAKEAQKHINDFFASFKFIEATDGVDKSAAKKDNPNKGENVEKSIAVSYEDVYLDEANSQGYHPMDRIKARQFYGGNTINGMIARPFTYGDSVYLPVDGFAKEYGTRKITWDSDTYTLEIGKKGTLVVPTSSSFKYPDVYPTEITVSLGGIALNMEGKNIKLRKEETLIFYEGLVYAPADLLCRVFDKKVEWRETEITASYGTFPYKYLLIYPQAAGDNADGNDEGDVIEADIQPDYFEPEPPIHLNINL